MVDSTASLLSTDLLTLTANSGSQFEDANLAGIAARASSVISPATPGVSALAVLPSAVDIERVGAVWSAQGAASATNGQVENIANQPVVGAIRTVVADPANANNLWIGAINGGVWRTTNATAANPTWTPLTDEFRSLSIGALALDPTDTDPEGDGRTIIAGIGRFSSYSGIGGPLTGVLLSTNGGTTFTQISPALLQGQNITSIAKRGNTILVSTDSSGVYRSTDNGTTWNAISGSNGLAVGTAFNLVGDATNNQRFYVSVRGVGIFRSDTSGANWINVSSADIALNTAITTTGNNNTRMAVSPVNGRIYAGVERNGQLVYIGFSDNQGANWAQMDLPVTPDTDGTTNTTTGLNPEEEEDDPGGQGAIHFSIVADPTNQNLVYIGGDRQPGDFPNSIGAINYTGRLFRGDTTQTATNPGSRTAIYSPQWQPLTHSAGGFSGGGTAHNSAPHADSRDMTFDASGNLLEVDDGGIYFRTSPQNAAGDWFSKIGNLQITEQHDIAYDTISNVLISGNQDTGTTQQTIAGSQTWRSVSQGDGGDVAVSVNPNNTAQSVRYSSFTDLNVFTRRVYDAANNFISATPISLTGFDSADGQFNTPIAINAVDPRRLIIGGAARVYESFNQGDTVSVVNTASGSSVGVNAFNGDPIAYGGRRNGINNPDVLYVGAGSRVLARTAAGGTLANTSYTGGFVRGIALDANDWQTAFAIDNNQVFQTTNAGTNWADITGDLSSLLSFNNGDFIESIEFVSSPTLNAIVVGTTQGIFASLSNDWSDWFAVGPTTLPHAPVWDIAVDPTDNVLAVGTLGRGAWLLANINTVLNSAPLPDAGSPYAVGEGGTIVLNATNSIDPNGLPLTFTWDLDGDGIFGETGAAAGRGDEVGANPTYSAAGLVNPSTRTVRLRATNSQGSSATTTATINVLKILNVAPIVTNLTVNPAAINEDNTVTLNGTFTDPGLLDSHTVIVNWGDGTSSTLPINQNQFARTFQTTHRYGDDSPTGTPVDSLPIAVTVTDNSGGIGQGNTSVTVNNVAPTLTNLTLSSTNINENDTITLNGTFTDPGLLDSHTVIVNWGDGTNSTLSVNQNQFARSFQFAHQYLDDNPSTGTPFDLIPITVTVVDDDTGLAQANTAVRVNNVNPIITSFSTNATFANRIRIGQPATINASFTDIGRLDTHRALVDWGDGTPAQDAIVTQGNGSGTVQGSHIYARGGAFTVRLILRDDDTGEDNKLTTAIIIGIANGPG